MRGRTHHRGQGHRPGPARPGRPGTDPKIKGRRKSLFPPPSSGSAARAAHANSRPTFGHSVHVKPQISIACQAAPLAVGAHALARPDRPLPLSPTGWQPRESTRQRQRAPILGSKPGSERAGQGRAGPGRATGIAGAARTRPWRCRQARKIGRRRRVADLSDRLGGPTPGRPGPGGPSCLLGADLPLLRPGRSDRRRRRRRQKRRRRRSTSAMQTKTAAASRLNIMSPGAASRNDMSHRA